MLSSTDTDRSVCAPPCSPAHSRPSALGVTCVSWPADGSILELTVEIILLFYFSVHFYPPVLCNNQMLGPALNKLVFFYGRIHGDF